MFDIGPTEIILICVVALLVIGPEKLPATVKTAGLWIGRFRRSFYKVKAEIERELNADEIRRQLHNESVMEEIEEAKTQVENVAKDTEKSVNKIVNTDNFDPGASKATEDSIEEEGKDKSIKEELQEVSDQVDDVAKQIYGTGKNPKLAEEDKPAEEKPDNDIG
jgi:sec-independent protein translocase protein TatB